MSEQIEKLPVGLRPREFHRKLRVVEILEAMGRYNEVGVAIPKGWIDELDRLNGEVIEEAGWTQLDEELEKKVRQQSIDAGIISAKVELEL